jgi:hypothetical protein
LQLKDHSLSWPIEKAAKMEEAGRAGAKLCVLSS